jgi:hypothetical protein
MRRSDDTEADCSKCLRSIRPKRASGTTKLTCRGGSEEP